MKTIRTLIVDDEPPARTKLRNLLAGEPDLVLCGEAGNGDEAIRLIGELRPDLVFLDVQMPRVDGLAVLRAVREVWLPSTIFTTAHSEHAVEAFNQHAVDYLLKPYTRERFSAAVQRARTAVAQRTSESGENQVEAILNDPQVSTGPVERFLVKTNERYLVVRTTDVIWVEAAANYVVLHTASGNHVLRRSMSALEGDLEPKRFFRSGRSAIVNLDCVREVQWLSPGEHVVLLQDGTKVPLTRSLREFQDRLQAPRD